MDRLILRVGRRDDGVRPRIDAAQTGVVRAHPDAAVPARDRPGKDRVDTRPHSAGPGVDTKDDALVVVGNPERAGATRDGRQPESPPRVGEVEAVDLLTLLDVDASEIVLPGEPNVVSVGQVPARVTAERRPHTRRDLAVRGIDPDERMRRRFQTQNLPAPATTSTGCAISFSEMCARR